jgi:hypothetical protein
MFKVYGYLGVDSGHVVSRPATMAVAFYVNKFGQNGLLIGTGYNGICFHFSVISLNVFL